MFEELNHSLRLECNQSCLREFLQEFKLYVLMLVHGAIQEAPKACILLNLCIKLRNACTVFQITLI